MTSNIDDLIRSLASDVTRVRPLASPLARAAVWIGASALYLLLLYFVWPHASAVSAVSIDRRFAIEQTAALLTGLTAAVAAFSLIVPGRSRTVAFLPFAPLVIWIAAVGHGCARDLSTGAALPAIVPHWGCLVATIVAGAVPAILIVFMLRRGAPLVPRLTTLLGALAVAGLANVCMRFIHASDPSFVVLTWHVVAVIALAAVLASGGQRAFNWQTISRDR